MHSCSTISGKVASLIKHICSVLIFYQLLSSFQTDSHQECQS